ncbi:MAG: hypothetical protein F6J98_08545 [Moorea sp. SIO4G2]|nr:hypothetical protein [Moorena sp. SIO4G2]
MLAVQAELQAGQLELQERQLMSQENQQRQERILEQLIGYSITQESDKLDLEERMNALEQRVRGLENR